MKCRHCHYHVHQGQKFCLMKIFIPKIKQRSCGTCCPTSLIQGGKAEKSEPLTSFATYLGHREAQLIPCFYEIPSSHAK